MNSGTGPDPCDSQRAKHQLRARALALLIESSPSLPLGTQHVRCQGPDWQRIDVRHGMESRPL